jgi:hypothetical protein
MKSMNLFQLKPGDRFFRVGDPKKLIREVKELIYKERYVAKSVVKYVIYTDLTEGHSDCPVCFLRNANDQIYNEAKDKFDDTLNKLSD